MDNKFESQIIEKNDDYAKIIWQHPSKGYGELTFRWNNVKNIIECDSEMMGIDSMFSIIKFAEEKICLRCEKNYVDPRVHNIICLECFTRKI